MAVTTTTQVTPAIDTYYDKVLLKRALPYLVHEKFGQVRPIDLKSGRTAKFRKYNSFSAATTPLTEGVTPTSQQLSTTDITATLAEYGAWTEITDMVDLTNQDPVLTEAGELLGEQAGLSIDTICREVLAAGTSVRYANGVAGTVNVTTKITATDLEVVIRALSTNNAKRISSIISPTTNYGTTPIPPSFIAIVHPYVTYDLMNSVTGFVPVEQYASQKGVMENEVGAYKGIRFIESTNAKVKADSGAAVGVTGMYSTTGASQDVFCTLVFAKDAYGVIPLRGKGLTNIRKPFGWNDPMNRVASSAWVAKTVHKILNESFMYRIETSATA